MGHYIAERKIQRAHHSRGQYTCGDMQGAIDGEPALSVAEALHNLNQEAELCNRVF
jgi:hypothetical protein